MSLQSINLNVNYAIVFHEFNPTLLMSTCKLEFIIFTTEMPTKKISNAKKSVDFILVFLMKIFSFFCQFTEIITHCSRNIYFRYLSDQKNFFFSQFKWINIDTLMKLLCLSVYKRKKKNCLLFHSMFIFSLTELKNKGAYRSLCFIKFHLEFSIDLSMAAREREKNAAVDKKKSFM